MYHWLRQLIRDVHGLRERDLPVNCIGARRRPILPVIFALMTTILHACSSGPDKPGILNNNALTDRATAGDSGPIWYNDYNPRVATDGQGNWLAAWYGNSPAYNLAGQNCPGNNSKTDVYTQFSKDNGKTWYGPFCLHSGDYDRSPQVVADGKGNWTMIWSADGAMGTDSDLFISRSTNTSWAQPAHPWSLAKVVNTNASSDSLADIVPDLATNRDGIWVAVWEAYGGMSLPLRGDVMFARSTDDIQTWSAPQKLSSGVQSTSDMLPAISFGKGVWVTVWQTQGAPELGSDGDILFSRSTDGLNWSAPAALNTNAQTDTALDESPHIAADGNGNWVTVWVSSDSQGGGTGKDRDILFALSIDGGQTWSAPKPVNTNAATDSGDDLSPRIAFGGGRWYVTWQSTETYGGQFKADNNIFMTGDTVTNGAFSWFTPSVAHSTASTDAGDDDSPDIAVDGQAKWVIVWSSDTDINGKGLDNDILYVKTTP